MDTVVPKEWNEVAITRQLTQIRDQRPTLVPHFLHSITFTGPGHATLGSGKNPSEHGIIANHWFDRTSAIDTKRWSWYFDDQGGWEMAERSGAVLRFDSATLPLYDGAFDAAAAGTRTGGDARNRAHLEAREG